jgi:hypothetical protein
MEAEKRRAAAAQHLLAGAGAPDRDDGKARARTRPVCLTSLCACRRVPGRRAGLKRCMPSLARPTQLTACLSV